MRFFAYGELADIFQLADSLSSLYFDNKNYCGFEVLHESVAQHCSLQTSEGKGMCSMSTIFKNLSKKHTMDVVGSVGILGESIKSFAGFGEMDSDDIYETTLTIGKQLGNIMARSIDI